MLPVLVIMLGVLIPIELKFGAEKGRMAMLIVYGIGFAVLIRKYSVSTMIQE